MNLHLKSPQKIKETINTNNKLKQNERYAKST